MQFESWFMLVSGAAPPSAEAHSKQDEKQPVVCVCLWHSFA
jgi:hypothetical protein